jgi:hypothetical protein
LNSLTAADQPNPEGRPSACAGPSGRLSHEPEPSAPNAPVEKPVEQSNEPDNSLNSLIVADQPNPESRPSACAEANNQATEPFPRHSPFDRFHRLATKNATRTRNNVTAIALHS